jgi:hypothetical protein
LLSFDLKLEGRNQSLAPVAEGSRFPVTATTGRQDHVPWVDAIGQLQLGSLFQDANPFFSTPPHMSDDYFFDDQDFDNSAFIAGLDAFEATHNVQYLQQTTDSTPTPAPLAPRPVFRPPSRPVPAPAPSTSRHKSPTTEVITISDGDEYKFDDSFNLEDANWDEFDQGVEVQIQQPHKTTGPAPEPPNVRQFSRTSSGKLQQQTLWGVPAPPQNKHKAPPRQKGKTIKKTKTWDRTEYAKSGWRVSKKGKDKVKNQGDEELHEEEPVEFEQFPRPTNLGGVHVCLT